VRDLARSVVMTLNADASTVAFEVFNVGGDAQNFQKRTIVDLIKSNIPDMNVRFICRDEDPRDYRVAFAKIKEALGFETTRTVNDGIREVHAAVSEGFIVNPDDPRYYNVASAVPRAA